MGFFFNAKEKKSREGCCEDTIAMPKIHKSHENGVGGVGLVRTNKKNENPVNLKEIISK